MEKEEQPPWVPCFVFAYFNFFIYIFLFSVFWDSVHRGPMGKAQWPPWNNQRLVITAEYLLPMTTLLSPVAANACHAFTKIEKPECPA